MRLRQPPSLLAEDRRGPSADFALAPKKPGFAHLKQDKFSETAYAKQQLEEMQAAEGGFKFRAEPEPSGMGE